MRKRVALECSSAAASWTAVRATSGASKTSGRCPVHATITYQCGPSSSTLIRHTLCIVLGLARVPRPFQPPVTRREQAIRSARGAAWARRRWLAVLLLGLVPLTAVAVASEIVSSTRRPVAAPAAGPILLATAVSTPLPTTPPTALATAAPTVVATAAPTSAPASAATTSSIATTIATTTPTAASAGSAAAAAPTSAPAPTGGPYRAYRVQPGDNLHAIANTYGVSVSSIAQASGLQNPDQLRVGQVLTIPNQNGTLYRVQAGETLDDIAARNGVSGSAIAEASDLATASVSPGQVILIPPKGANVTATPGK